MLKNHKQPTYKIVNLNVNIDRFVTSSSTDLFDPFQQQLWMKADVMDGGKKWACFDFGGVFE